MTGRDHNGRDTTREGGNGHVALEKTAIYEKEYKHR